MGLRPAWTDSLYSTVQPLLHRATLYHRLKSKGKLPPAIEVEDALNDVATQWVVSLASAGIRVRRGIGQNPYEWLFKGLNPAPEIAPYPGDEDLPFGYD